MVAVSVVGDRLHLEVQGFDKLWSFRSQLELPLEHVTSVSVDPEAARGWWGGGMASRLPARAFPLFSLQGRSIRPEALSLTTSAILMTKALAIQWAEEERKHLSA